MPLAVPRFRCRYEKKGGPAARLTKRIGSTYTASVFVNLYSLLCSIPAPEMKGKRVSVFSYGSGSASTMYHLEVKGEVKMDRTVFDRLSARQNITVRPFSLVSFQTAAPIPDCLSLCR
jgi:3-hydroxy-3-methylglutaryl CoA synthase|eukprot:COSAG06_NODE_467_length_15342_cov_93.241225_6_plen_118_part_00